MKRKGFTLIELLAVIVILAIIALITTPMIMDVIEKSKKGAAIDSVYGYLEALEQYIVLQDENTLVQIEPNGTYQVESDISYSVDSVPNVYLNEILSYKGKAPEDGYIELENSKLVYGELDVNGYHIVCLSSTNCKIGEHIDATDITIIENANQANHYVGINDSLQLHVSINPEGANPKIQWSSSNEEVATVSNTGLVTPVSYGNTVITAKVSNTLVTEFALEVSEFYEKDKTYLYKRGKDNTKLTGGYIEQNQTNMSQVAFDLDSIYMDIKVGNSFGRKIYTQKQIDVTGYRSINMKYKALEEIDSTYNTVHLCFSTVNSGYFSETVKCYDDKGLKKEETTISLEIPTIDEENNEYFVAITAGSLKPYIYEIWLEK